MAGKFRLLLSLLLLPPCAARAGDECYRDSLVVDQTLEWNFEEGSRVDLMLPTYNPHYGMMPTRAAAHFSSSGGNLNIFFDYDSNQMSLPYNVFRLDLEVGQPGDDDVFRSTVDFTSGCVGVSPSIYPGRRVDAFPVKVPAHANGEARGREPLRIRIWGKIR